MKNYSHPKKQNKKFSQNNERFPKNVAAQGFGFLEGITNCYF